MVSDLSTVLSFFALVVIKLLSSNLCCTLSPVI